MQIALRHAEHNGLVARTATVVLLSASEAEAHRSWIQVAKVGKFKNYVRGGKKATLSITKSMLSEMLSNFTTGKHPEKPTELCVDYEHLSAAPTDALSGKAAGWYRALELRDEGRELWGEIEWTETAATAIEKKEFKFFSPEFHLNYTTHDGDEIGCTLLAGAITNRPFLQGMDAVELRGATGDVLATDLSYDQRRMFVERALRAHYRAAQGIADGCYISVWVCELYDDYVVFKAPDGRTMWADYAIAADGTTTITEPFEEVVISYEALSADPAKLRARGEHPTMNTIKLRNAQNEEVEIAADALEQTDLVKQLRKDIGEMVPKADVAKLNTDVVTLAATVKTLQDENAASAKSMAERDAKDAVEGLVTARRVVPAQRESLTALYLKDKALFETVTAAMTATVAPAEGEKGHGQQGGEGASSVVDEVNAEVKKLRDADGKLSVQDATAQVFHLRPELYGRYVKSVERPVGKGE